MKILFSHAHQFTPLIRSLRNDLDGLEVYTVTPQYAGELTGLEIEAHAIREYAQGLEVGAFAWAAAVIRDLPRVVQSLNGKYPTLGFFPEAGDSFYYPRLADVAVASLALDRIKPDLIVLHNDVEPTHRALGLWAGIRGVPCLHVPHAIYQMVNRTPLGTDVHDLVTASNIAAAGPFQRQWYEGCGAEPESITETGLPQYDKWAEREPMGKGQAMKLLNLDPFGAPVVVYAGTWGQSTNILGATDEWQANYMMFLEAVRDLEVQVVVKCHPRGGQQNWSWYADNAKAAGVVASVTPSHLEVCVDASDVFYAPFASNVLLEAAHNPNIRLLSTYGYDGDRAVGQVEMEPESIRAAIVKALGSKAPSTGSLLEKYLGPCDGRNGERVAELCKELLNV